MEADSDGPGRRHGRSGEVPEAPELDQETTPVTDVAPPPGEGLPIDDV